MKKLLFTIQVAAFLAAFPLLSYLEVSHSNNQPEAQVASPVPVSNTSSDLSALQKKTHKPASLCQSAPAEKISIVASAPLFSEEQVAMDENEIALTGSTQMPVVAMMTEPEAFRPVKFSTEKEDMQLARLMEILKQVEQLQDQQWPVGLSANPLPCCQKNNHCVKLRESTL